MKRVCVLILLLASGLLLPLASSHAADLQAGWYANILEIQISPFDPANPERNLTHSGYFYTEGQYGPFTVSTDPWYGTQYVSVPTNAYGVGPEQSLILPIWCLQTDLLVGGIGWTWQTNYDPNQMRLELWWMRLDGSEDLVWAQTQGGQRQGSAGGCYWTYYERGYYFKVQVLPEPTGIASLLMGLGGLSVMMRKRRVHQC